MGNGASIAPKPKVINVIPTQSQSQECLKTITDYKEVQIARIKTDTVKVTTIENIKSSTERCNWSTASNPEGDETTGCCQNTERTIESKKQIKPLEVHGHVTLSSDPTNTSGHNGSHNSDHVCDEPVKQYGQNFVQNTKTLQWQQAGEQQRGSREPHHQSTQHEFSSSVARQMEEEDVISFETFYHRNGTSFTCIKQLGQVFYIDSFNTQEWQPFPNHWYSCGHFERDGEPIQDNIQPDLLSTFQQEQGQWMPSLNHGPHSSSVQNPSVRSGSNMDDRAGTIQHPTCGRILTYLFEEKRNIHFYFDDATGNWIKMPISWELHTNVIQPILQQIQEAIPTWVDTHDVVAALRQSNYDVDDTLLTYYSVCDTGCMDLPQKLAGCNLEMIEEKDEQIFILQTKLVNLQSEHEALENRRHVIEVDNNKMRVQFASAEEKVACLEVEVKTNQLQVASLQRPKTRAISQIKTKKKKVPTATLR